MMRSTGARRGHPCCAESGSLKSYLLLPLWGLAAQWHVKAPVAVGLGFLWQALKEIGVLYLYLFQAQPVLILLAATLFVADLFTGIVAARLRREQIVSDRLRQTGWKLIEYACVVGVCMMIANGFVDTIFAAAIEALEDAALLYVCLTEGFSVIENATGSREKARRIIHTIKDVMSGEGDTVIEEVVKETPLPEAPHVPDEEIDA